VFTAPLIQAHGGTNIASYIRSALAHSYHQFSSGALPQDGFCSIRVIEGAVTPRACPARPRMAHMLQVVSIASHLDLCYIGLFQNSSIYARLQREHPKIALEINHRHRQRLTLCRCSSSPVRITGLQIKIKIYFDSI
jgi:hypothetical protein